MEHTRFVGLDIHKERISIAVAESGRSGGVEYLGEISNDPVAIGKLCDRLGRSGKTLAFCYEAVTPSRSSSPPSQYCTCEAALANRLASSAPQGHGRIYLAFSKGRWTMVFPFS